MTKKEIENKRPLCIVGYSGHSYVVIETLRANGYEVVAYCDLLRKDLNPFELEYFGTESDTQVLLRLKQNNYLFFPTIGDNKIREQIFNHMAISLDTLIAEHSSAIVSSSSIIGRGTFIGAGAIIQAYAKVGNGVICNSGCIIEHECQIEDFVHVAPGAVLCGNVHVEKGSLVGAGAVVNPGIRIGCNAIIGSGAVVTRDVPAGTIFAGNPAKNLKVSI